MKGSLHPKIPVEQMYKQVLFFKGFVGSSGLYLEVAQQETRYTERGEDRPHLNPGQLQQSKEPLDMGCMLSPVN